MNVKPFFISFHLPHVERYTEFYTHTESHEFTGGNEYSHEKVKVNGLIIKFNTYDEIYKPWL